ncbi:AAA family ATPase [Gordonia sp. CPCC 206044]|uniref:AAA family ATPase n=1 Tax=Gordonia sp. CPCC 206044 TaxID=3140793 RepID=UPI003AF40392
MRGDIVLLTGPPGAGKSTTAAALAAGFEKSVHLHTDDFWHYIVSGAIPPYLPESDQQNQTAMRAIALTTVTYAEGGYTVVVDGVVGPWMLHHFDAAVREAITVHYLVLRPSRETALARAVGRSGPDDLTDAEPILAMWDQFADLGNLERHVLDTGDQTPGQTLQMVRDAVAGSAFRLASPD